MKRILEAGKATVASLLTSKTVSLQVGDKAPDFNARSTLGEITLYRLLHKGPVVLAFYYADFTPG